MRIMSLAALVRSAAVVAAAVLACVGVSVALPAPAEAAVGHRIPSSSTGNRSFSECSPPSTTPGPNRLSTVRSSSVTSRRYRALSSGPQDFPIHDRSGTRGNRQGLDWRDATRLPQTNHHSGAKWACHSQGWAS